MARYFMFILFSLGGVAAMNIGTNSQRTAEELVGLFDTWVANNSKSYEDLAERQLRYEIFKSNLDLIDAHNSEESSFTLALNKFADLTLLEFKGTYLSRSTKPTRHANESTGSFRYASVTPRASMDWRSEGAVTAIKDQGQCGSCWAFSTIGAVEGIVHMKTGKLISLSEQELVSCDTAAGNDGCNGGWMNVAMQWIVQNGGVNSETAYPYTAKDDACNTNEMETHVVSIDGEESVPSNNEAALQQAVASQPISVAIDGGASAFQFYATGILSGSCGNSLDHAVVAVGYGTTDGGVDFWIVKNSWGTGWGERGFMRLQRNISAKQGMCGIAMSGSYPVKN